MKNGMNTRKDPRITYARLIVSIAAPLLLVTLGGLIVYGSFSAFLSLGPQSKTTAANGPAVIYYGLAFVIALMFFLMREGYAGYEFIALGAVSLAFALSLQRTVPAAHRPLYAYLAPLLLFFLLMWPILKLIFLNPLVRAFRLVIFALFSAAAFSIAFWLMFLLLKLPVEPGFIQTKFFSGLLLFIFLGVGLSIAELVMRKMVKSEKLKTSPDIEYHPAGDDEQES